MGRFVVSVLLQSLSQIDPDLPGLNVTGANLIVAQYFRRLLESPEVEALELFVTPADYQRQALMASIAKRVLPKERQGKGILRFYPVHAIPEVWADAAPRILLSLDPGLLSHNRYLRDRFAIGPMAISCQTHGMGDLLMYTHLQRLAGRETVACDSLVCLSEACRESFRRTFGGYLAPAGTPPPCRLDLIPNPVDIDRFRPASPEEKLRCRKLLYLPEEGTLTLYLGRLSPASKADLLPLLRQFAKVSGRQDHLVFAGVENVEGYADRLRREAVELGLGDRFQLRAFVDPWSSPIYYAAADLYVFPCDNVQECLGNTALEAMACGLPTILSDFDGLRDASIHEETGFLIPTYINPSLRYVEDFSCASPFMTNLLMVAQSIWVDTTALGEALRALLGSPDLRKRMGDSARARIETGYSWEAVGGRLFALWDELLAIAKAESSEERERRRAESFALGLPAPFLHLFEKYATAALDMEKDRVRLSGHGANIADGRTELAYYDETLALVRPEITDALLDTLRLAGADWITVGDLVSKATGLSGADPDLVRYNVGLLLKRDVLEYQAFWSK